MVVKRVFKTITATTTTATGNIGTIRGKILKVSVTNDTGSCGWWIFTDASDNTTGDGDAVDENIIGATGAGHIDTQAATYYPVIGQVTGVDATLTDPDQYSPIMVDGKVEYNIDSCADTEVMTITIWYEPFSD